MKKLSAFTAFAISMVTLGAHAAPPPPPPPPSKVKTVTDNISDALSNNIAKTRKAYDAYKSLEADIIGKQAQLDALEGKSVLGADEKMSDSTKKEIAKLKDEIAADTKLLKIKGNSLKTAYGAVSANIRQFSKKMETLLADWQKGIMREQKTEIGSANKVGAPKQDVNYMEELMNKLKNLRESE